MHAGANPGLNEPVHDVPLDGVIKAFERAFPGRVRGYYVHGSLADFTDIATSDVDIDIVVKGTFTDESEQTRFIQTARDIADHSRRELDIEVLDELYLVCRGQWHYLVPPGSDERRHLRAICQRVLAFENHFLTCFKPFLLDELHRAAEGEENRALWLMREIPFEDDAVRAAVSQACHGKPPFSGISDPC